jgi:hypothetical protein
MRLYRRLNPLNSGITASINNKGLLVCNTDSATTFRNITAYVLNYDNTITGLELSAVGPSQINQMAPNYILLPFTITSWTNNSGVSLNGFELF